MFDLFCAGNFYNFLGIEELDFEMFSKCLISAIKDCLGSTIVLILLHTL